MVISYESYVTSLRRVSWIPYEMTTSVRFCLSYAKMLCNEWSYDFYDMTGYPQNNNDVHMINLFIIYDKYICKQGHSKKPDVDGLVRKNTVRLTKQKQKQKKKRKNEFCIVSWR